MGFKMKKDPLYLLLIAYIILFFIIHFYYGYSDFILILIFLFFFIKFRYKNIFNFIFFWIILFTYYLIKYFILFENWMIILLSIVPLFVFLKKENFHKISRYLAPISFVVLLIFTIFALYKSGVFNNEPPIMNDYPYHFYRAWLVSEFLIPRYGNIVGWVPYFQAGYTELYDYPPGGFILTYFVKQVTLQILSIEMSFRTVVFFSFILSIFSVFFFSYKFTKSLWTGIISSFFWVAWTHYYFIESFFSGYYSLSFMLISLTFYKIWFEKRKMKFFLLSCLFSGLASLFHPEMFLYTLLLISVFHFIFFKKTKFFYPIVLILISLSIGAIYLTQGIIGLNYLEISTENQIKFWPEMFDIRNTFLNEYLFQFTVPLFLTIFGPATLYILYRKNDELKRNIKYLLFNIFLMIVVLFTIHFLQTLYPHFPINILRIQRASYALRIFVLTLASYSLVNILKTLIDGKTSNHLLAGLIFFIVIFFISSNMLYFYDTSTSSDYSKFKRVYWGNNFQDVYQLNFTRGVFSFEPKKGILELIEWLKNEDIKSRILTEDSTSRSLGGQALGLLPIYTGKNFVGGPFPMIQTAEFDRNAYEGYFFGKPIKEYSLDDFKNRLNDLNVKYLVVWNRESKSFISSFPDEFRKINSTSDGLFHIYQYLNAPESYFESNKNLSIEMGESEIKIGKEGFISEDIIIKSTYNPNWHAYVEGREFPVEEDKNSFIKISKSVCEKCNITLIYKEGRLEMTGKLISLSSLTALILLIAFSYIPSKYSHVFRKFK